MFREALGDLQIDVARTVVEGEMVAVHCCVRANTFGNAFGALRRGAPLSSGG